MSVVVWYNSCNCSSLVHTEQVGLEVILQACTSIKCSAMTPVILTEMFYGFYQSLQANRWKKLPSLIHPAILQLILCLTVILPLQKDGDIKFLRWCSNSAHSKLSVCICMHMKHLGMFLPLTSWNKFAGHLWRFHWMALLWELFTRNAHKSNNYREHMCI